MISIYHHMLSDYHIWSYLSSRIMMYHVIGNWLSALGWTPLIKSCNSSVLHHQFIPGIQLTQSSGIRSAMQWTWAKTKTSANQRYRRRWRELLAIQIHSGKCLWFIISAADGRGHCALFKQFLSTKILRPDGVAAPIVLCYSRFTQEAHQPKNCGVVHTRSGRTMAEHLLYESNFDAG